MPTDEEILAYHLAHPMLAPGHIAIRLGCCIDRAVRVVNQHMAKTRPKDYEPTPEEIAEFMRVNRAAHNEEREWAQGTGKGSREPAVREYSTQITHRGTFIYVPE